MSQPTPTPLLKAKMKTAGFAAAAMTLTGAMTLGVTAAPEILASRDHAIEMAQMQAQIDLAASIGVYPSGPLFQAARMAGLGNADSALNALQNLAGLIGQDGIASTIEFVRNTLAALETGVTIPVLGNLAIPQIRVPAFGPAGIVDGVDSLEYSATTQALLSTLKTVLLNSSTLGDLLGGVIGGDAGELIDDITDAPLNVPGTSVTVGSGVFDDIWGWITGDDEEHEVGVFSSSVGQLAIVPTWGLGGTNAALASGELMKMKDEVAVLVIALRNTSRPGGGIVALLNPFSQLVGLNLSNADGRGTTTPITDLDISIGGIDLVDVEASRTDGNLTTWDITAAYDLLSDAPSTIYNPLAWANSGVGFVMPTYLIPKSIGTILDGNIVGGLLETIDGIHFDVGEDGNWYITYDSGNLPLLEPVQFLPRTLSYLDGFDISTPVSSSLDSTLRTLVATGYQDVGVTDNDGDGVYKFERQWDMGGTQAQFWESPIGFTEGAELPQTVFNELIQGLQENLLDPSGNNLELFGNDTLTKAVYQNALAVPVAQFISDALEQLRTTLNPLINDAQGALKPVTEGLDSVANQLKTVIDTGLDEGAANTPVNLTEPLLEVNRFVNKVTEPLDNGIPNAIGNLFNGNSTTSSLFAARGAGDDAVARTSADADANVLKLPGADLLKDTDLGANARKVAEALKNPAAGLKDGAEKAEARVSKQFGKVKGNLAAEKARADRLVGAVKSGKPDNVVKTVKENVKERVSQVKKDLNDGAKKVEKTVKKVTDRDAA